MTPPSSGSLPWWCLRLSSHTDAALTTTRAERGCPAGRRPHGSRMGLVNQARLCNERTSLQFQELGGLIESPVEAGEGERKRKMLMQLMGGCKLHAVVATQGEGLGEHTSFFDQ